MKRPTYRMRQRVWIYPSMDGWHFVHVSKKASAEIKAEFGYGGRGFGSIPVIVTVGKTKWRTSIFPDSKSGTYLLPLKAAVRKAEGIAVDTLLSYSIEIIV